MNIPVDPRASGDLGAAASSPRRRRSAWSALSLACAALLTTAADDAPPGSRAPEVRVVGDKVTMPIVMVKEFPFIEGEIAGVKGKLMFDTGAPNAFVVNDHRVPLTGGRTIGTGHFGSGQSYSINLVPEVRGVKVGPLTFPKVTSVTTQDARQLETNVTPDFIGWLGYEAFGDHAFKLDYRRSKVTFYAGGPRTYLAGEKVIAELPFEPRKRPNDPILPIRIGDVTAEAVFDTGQYGALYLDAATKTKLVEAGWLKPSAQDKDAFDLTGLSMAGKSVAPIDRLEVTTEPYRPGKSVGMTGAVNMTIGYGFLRHYKTVWDYGRRRLYLLAP